MAITQIAYTGDGSTVLYTFPFEYIDESEIIVEVDRTVTTAYSFANPTTIQFDTAPANGVLVLITRNTDIDTTKVIYYPGSAIKAEDLNTNFDQSRLSVQEWRDQKVPYYNAVFPDRIDLDGNAILNVEDPTNAQDAATKNYVDTTTVSVTGDSMSGALDMGSNNITNVSDPSNAQDAATKNYVDTTTWNVTDETIESGETWVSSNSKVATTAAIDARFQDELSETIESDETWVSDDDHIATTQASDAQYTTLVQLTTPTGSDYPVGKTWLQNDIDKTLSIWNGSAWVAVASGGSFTELPKVVYVDAVNGDDNLLGHRISNPKRTIKAAIEQINAETDEIGNGSVVILAPGVYGESFPIDIQKNDVSIVGTSLRNCIIHPAIPEADQAGYDVDTPHANELTTMFRVNSGTYIAHLTMSGMKASGTRGGNSLDTDATYGLPTNQGWNIAFYPGAVIRKSPYIQNCTNFSDSQIDNVNFTPHVPGEGSAGDLDSAPSGGGILINGATVASNSPLRSMVCDSYTHTALDGPGIFVTNNGYCQATSSYAFFCHYHLKTKNGGQANLAASTSDFGRYSLIADGRSTTAIFTATTTTNAADGATTFTIGAPSVGAVWHGSATRPQDNMLVDIGGNTYPVLSSTANGSGWDVTISRPDPDNLSLNLGLDGAVNSGSAVSFYLRSMVASSGHTMEYVGSGTDYRALPENGGVPDDNAQLVELNDGKIWAASTDHKGTFKVGSTFSVNQQTGFISLGAGSFEIPNLLANLDLNGFYIFDSEGDVVINDQMDISGNKITNVADPTSAQDVTTKNYVDTNFVNVTDIDVTVQSYDADTAKYDDTTANFTGTLQQGGSNVVVDSDIDVTVQSYDADTAVTDVAQTFTAAQRGEITTLTSGATVTPDFSDSNNYTLTLDQNLTIANPTNLVAGQSGSIFLVQDGTGSRTAAWGSYWDFAGGTAPTLTTTASAVDRIDYVVRSSTSIHAVATLNYS